MSDLLYVNVWTGQPGPTGATAQWRSGIGTPANTLGVDGDNYVDLNTGKWWQRASGSYSVIGDLRFIPQNGSSFIALPNGTAYLLNSSTGLYHQIRLGVFSGTATLQVDSSGVTYAVLVIAYNQPVPVTGASVVHMPSGNLWLQDPTSHAYYQMRYGVGIGGVATIQISQIPVTFDSLT